MARPVLAQQIASADVSRIRILIDCVRTRCDQEFFRTEIPFVDHVRERQDADVHVLITSRPSATGGQEVTLSFFGQGRFGGDDDVLRHIVVVGESDDGMRRELVRLLTLGLVRYAVHSAVAGDLSIALRSRAQRAASRADPWNNWTFRTQLNGNSNGERSNRFSSIFGSFTANRTTEAWKANVSLRGAYRESTFQLPDGRRFVSPNRDHGTNLLVVKSVGGRWSAGMRAALASNTFLNQRSEWRLAPALEYDFFPYAESTRRLFTVQYALGVRSTRYSTETIFGRTAEQFGNQTVSVSLTLRQRWGTVGSTLEAASFLPQLDHNHVTLFGDVDLNLVRGLSLNLNANITSLRDQVYLPRTPATSEEVLVRQRQLATTYRYFASFGISYTFGSIYSAVVNPRFGGPGGGF